MEEKDIGYMNRAIELAEKGKGWVNPNPLVGAVIVKDDRIIGEGWHERFGGSHAERNALACCSENPSGATLYVTLEPCCHHGKTPPCTDAVIAHGIARVVVGIEDPNPLVSGKGIEALRLAGITVETGVGEEKIREQNRVFLKYITTRTPWIIMKTAMTLDGKIASFSGDSRWVTGEEARCRGQELRHICMGIMVGAGTVSADNPLLTCRLGDEVRQPVRIVVDSCARLDMHCRLVETAGQYRTIVAHTSMAPEKKIFALRKAGVETLLCGEEECRVNPGDLTAKLGEAGIDSVLLEGGGELNEAFLRAGLIDEVFVFIAPKLIGGRNAVTPVGGRGFGKMSEAVNLSDVRVEMVGRDLLVRGRVG